MKRLFATCLAAVLISFFAVAAYAQTSDVLTLGSVTPTANSVTITGTVSNNANEAITIKYTKTDDPSSPNLGVNGTVTNGTLTQVLSSLDPATKYTFLIQGSTFTEVSGSFTTTGDSTTSGSGTATLGTITSTSSTITIEGTVTSTTSEPITIKYTKSDDPSSPNLGIHDNTANGMFRVMLTSLDPATKYTFLIQGTSFGEVSGTFSTKAAGTGTASGTTTAGTTTGTGSTTGSGVGTPGPTKTVSGVVSTLLVSDITQTTATISGKLLKTASIVILVDTKDSDVYDVQKTPTIAADKTFKFVLDKLEPFHFYTIVVAKAGDTSTGYTIEQNFKTLPVSATPYIAALTDTTATVMAKISDGAKTPYVQYGKDSKSLAASTPIALTKNSDGLYTADIKGLTADTIYGYQIVGKDGTTLYLYTGEFKFTTHKKGDTVPTVGTITPDGTGTNPVSTTTLPSGGIVQCGKDGALDTNGKQSCGFPEFISLVSRVIDFLLVIIAPAIAVCVILYAGLLVLTSAGSTENVTKAKDLFFKAVIGLAIAMCAWLLVKFIMVKLGYNEAQFPKFY